MVSIFKTNIPCRDGRDIVINKIKQAFPAAARVTVDTEDCDKVLRVVGVADQHAIMELVQQEGYLCEILNS